MRFAAGLLLAVLLAGAAPAAPAAVAVRLASRPVPGSCAVLSTATIVGYDLPPAQRVRYRFVRSDGSLSPPATLALGGDGAVARSVVDRWTPRGAAPWIAVEILTPQRTRSARLTVTPHCTPPAIAQR